VLTGVDNEDSGGVSPGEVLRQLRQAAGHSLGTLAKLTNMHPTMISHLERGARPMRPRHAAILDKALDTVPVLQSLVTEEEGDGMDRRAMLWGFAAAASVSAATGRATLDELLRAGLLDAVELPEDWDPVLTEMQRRLVMAPDGEFGAALSAKLLVVRQAIADHGRADDVRAAALLSLFYGLWQGNGGHFSAATDWYRTAAALARKSRDDATHTYVLGRSASRAVYEGMSRGEVTDLAEQALAVTDRPTLGGLEARSALAGVAAMTGDLDGGREQVQAMRRLADQLPDDGPTGAYPRTVNFDIFVEARVGTPKSVERAQDEAEIALARTPLWLAESRVYYALSMARAGYVRGAAKIALDAIQTVPWSVHTLAMAASDVLTAVPRDDRTDEVMELRRYASPTPGPWETL
jgi:transcriptional regulator with XRE-family HTH domain